ncbi:MULTISPECIES: arsenate reductase family protein [Hyphomonas]|uniref:Arsenate reductase n=1 Tax=Hyphomonas adhaerens TaxID=81029 RepID=A0A3B9H3Q6_9PROT|nr:MULTISPECIES: arsenate reductase family protein [Hyphomonas]MBB39248.1 arsenate reductase [Hyphomonas sp.]HAE29323.1 arsenate reductase [Hyphomonas adhaerens]|tara:strand:+ start:83 stop:430 length:348 start_codon:yes stop_codon:yes gene_type:complete
MSYTILHNPNCSTSRKGLDLLKEAGIEPDVRKYMNATERLSVEELKDIAKKMGGVSPRVFMRSKDAPAAGIDANSSDEAIFEAMAENPKLIQRPIGIKGKKAVLGRPPEDLLKLA